MTIFEELENIVRLESLGGHLNDLMFQFQM